MIAGSEGGCDCGQVRYRLAAEPIVVKCCHCRACQRQSGTAFALNIIIEAEHVELLSGALEPSHHTTASGHGQRTMRCPACKVSVWTVYNMAGDRTFFVRAGTLDEPHAIEPDLHIFTESKLPWVRIPDDAEQFARFYTGKDIRRVFGEDGAARFKAVTSR